MIDIAFAKFENIVPFLHVLGAAIFIGANINVWFVSRFIFKRIVINEDNVDIIFCAIDRFAIVLFASMSLIFLSGMFSMDKNILKMADPMLEAIIATKLAIFGFVCLNIGYMIFRYKKALNAKKEKEYLEVRENLVIILRYFTPLNIVCMCFAIFLGINFGNL